MSRIKTSIGEDVDPPGWAGFNWTCPVCTTRNSAGQNAECDACSTCFSPRPSLPDRGTPMHSILLDECSSSIQEAARTVSNQATVFGKRQGSGQMHVESDHPVTGRQHTIEVSVEGASSLYVTFDVDSSTPRNQPDTRVEFFADRELTCLVAVRKGPAFAFKPFLAPCSKLYAKTTHRPIMSTPWTGWGCTARGMSGVRWSSESDVEFMPSLEWGSWLLQYLASEALTPSLLRGGALHTGGIVTALGSFI